MLVGLEWRKTSYFTQCNDREKRKRGVHDHIINIVMRSLISPYGICMLDFCCEQESTRAWTHNIQKKLFAYQKKKKKKTEEIIPYI